MAAAADAGGAEGASLPIHRSMSSFIREPIHPSINQSSHQVAAAADAGGAEGAAAAYEAMPLEAGCELSEEDTSALGAAPRCVRVGGTFAGTKPVR